MAEQFKNNAQSVLASTCLIGDTAIVVANAASFPTTGDFRLLIDTELMLCTGVIGTLFNVTRAIEGTIEANHSLSAPVILPLTAGSLATIGGGGGGPTGPAGGALSGTYPNPDLASTVAGDGLSDTANVLAVNVDGSSIEINTDTLRVKALGVTNAMLAGTIVDSKLATSYTKSDGSRAFTGPQSMGSNRITSLSDPLSAQDAVTLTELINSAVGLMAASVGLGTTAALPACTYSNGSSGFGATLTANANGFLTVDGTLTFLRNRIVVMNQAAQEQNGIYRVSQHGDAATPFILTRAPDMQYTNEFSNKVIFIIGGSTLAGRSVRCLTDSPVIGTDPVTFSFFPLADGSSVSVAPSVTNDNETGQYKTPTVALSFGTVVV